MVDNRVIYDELHSQLARVESHGFLHILDPDVDMANSCQHSLIDAKEVPQFN